MSNLSLPEALKHVGREDLVKVATDLKEDYTFTDKNATFISFVNGLVKGASSVQLQSCEDHAKFWKIQNECAEASRKIASYKPPVYEDQDFALLQTLDGKRVRKYAACDKDTTVRAADAFYQNRAKYPLSWRKTASARLLARAEKYEAHLPEYIETYLHKAASLGFPTADTLSNIMIERLNRTDARSKDETIEKFASVMEEMIENDVLRMDHEFVKTAMEAIENFDTHLGITGEYGNGLSLPEEIIASSQTTDKLAKVAGVGACEVALINGHVVDVTELKKEALAAVDAGLADLGPMELAEVLPTLPQGDADLLTRLS